MDTTHVAEFVKFIEDYITPARTDIIALTDTNRVHIQKLLYTNLVDRFDAMVDSTILSNCRHPDILTKATAGMDKEIRESDLLTLLMDTDSLQEAIDSRLKNSLRLTALRDRHSKKLLFLLQNLCQMNQGVCMNKPRVRLNTGAISDTDIRVDNRDVPQSICGYADWLYSRRNTIVHGGGSSAILQNDKAQLKKLYKCDVANRIRITLQAVDYSVVFYRAVSDLVLECDS